AEYTPEPAVYCRAASARNGESQKRGCRKSKNCKNRGRSGQENTAGNLIIQFSAVLTLYILIVTEFYKTIIFLCTALVSSRSFSVFLIDDIQSLQQQVII